MLSIMIILNMWRIIPAYCICVFSKSHEYIFEEFLRWSGYYRKYNNNFMQFGYLLVRIKEFRNLVAYRLGSSNRLQEGIFTLLFRPLDTLYINTKNIGRNLFIHHGFSTIISAESIGDNCWINQQVTIGNKPSGSPKIGSNVKICAGAIIVGGVSIGDYAIVGAGAVVTKDIPGGEVWAGNPAHFIKKCNLSE